MSSREAFVLSPYRVPAQNPLNLSSEDTACFLNALSALWHPAALHGAVAPPRIESPYDYEQPKAGHLYALTETPPLVMPDDWEQRVRDAGAAWFRATADREATLANLRAALKHLPEENRVPAPLLDLSADKIAPFLGLGFGHRMVETLFEAMEHENTLVTAEFWQEVQNGVALLSEADPEAFRHPLQAAAERLLAAREILYPVNIFLVDIGVLDEHNPGATLPASFDKGFPLNLVASAAVLERLAKEAPDRLTALRERVHRDMVEVCGGTYVDRADALLPVESQDWNLLKGLTVSKQLLDQEIQVFARKRFAAQSQLPLLLSSVGLRRALLLAFDESVLPAYRVTVTSWPAPNGKQIEAFTRAPFPADSPQTFFHWAHHLRQTIAQDHSATLGLVHAGATAAPWYGDLLELCRLAPVFGQWVTLSRYFNDVMAGEYASAVSPDEFTTDYLSPRATATESQAVSAFSGHVRRRRRFDTAWSLAALHRGLTGRADPSTSEDRLRALEDRVEGMGDEPGSDLTDIEQQTAEALANRLLARASGTTPGYLLLNPCSFARRVALTLPELQAPVAVGGPVKASQLDGSTARLVVEVPALGFAWFPQRGATTAAPPSARMRLADSRAVRNEFFEAEIDPATGGLRALRDHRTRVNRIGQQLVFNPGSVMRAREIKVLSTGPAVGEIGSEGVIVNEQNEPIAEFRQHFRAWLGRPLLELAIEIRPQRPVQGYPWHAYYGARFAWRDERAALLRSVNGTGYVTSQTRPETPDYLELRSSRSSTLLLPAGLPFHQRHGDRMLDIILIPEGETERRFEIGLALDRENPMQTAFGMVSPVSMVPTAKGPPHIGAAGWLFHLDSPNLLLTSLRPAADGADAILVRLLECHNHTTSAELRCARNPRRAVLLDARGDFLLDASTSGDAVLFDVPAGDLVQLRIEFT
jgi:hypothetical protein